MNLLRFAESERVAALKGLDARTQSELGQHFTPIAAAQLIASMPRLPASGTHVCLILVRAPVCSPQRLASRVLAEQPELSIEIVAVECDPVVLPNLQATLSACERAGGGRVRTEIIEADFILDTVGLGASLNLDGQFDLVIENPPYGKLAVSSTRRAAMRAAGIDVPNLYAAFLSLSVTALREGGQVVAITPRSFFNGPYFGAFRAHLLDSIALDRVHVFDSRSTVFADTGVLQENVIFAGTRGAIPGVVELSVSHNHADTSCAHKVSSRNVAYEEVVFPNDPHRFIRLATDANDTAVAEIVLSQPCSLTDLGLQVSTGRVVDFRSRHALSAVNRPGAVPLVYPGNLRDGGVLWPRKNSQATMVPPQ